MKKYLTIFSVLSIVSIPAFAMKPSMGSMHKACGDDVQKYCADIEKGKGNIIECLEKNSDKLSAECKEDMTKKKAAMDARRENAGNPDRDGKMKKDGTGQENQKKKSWWLW